MAGESFTLSECMQVDPANDIFDVLEVAVYGTQIGSSIHDVSAVTKIEWSEFDPIEKSDNNSTCPDYKLKSPVIYTTKLDDMKAFDKIERHTSQEITEMILKESKPRFKQIPKHSEPQGVADSTTYSKLFNRVYQLNGKVKDETYTRNKKLLRMCKPLKIVLKDMLHKEPETSAVISDDDVDVIYTITDSDDEPEIESWSSTIHKNIIEEKGNEHLNTIHTLQDIQSNLRYDINGEKSANENLNRKQTLEEPKLKLRKDIFENITTENPNRKQRLQENNSILRMNINLEKGTNEYLNKIQINRSKTAQKRKLTHETNVISKIIKNPIGNFPQNTKHYNMAEDSGLQSYERPPIKGVSGINTAFNVNPGVTNMNFTADHKNTSTARKNSKIRSFLRKCNDFKLKVNDNGKLTAMINASSDIANVDSEMITEIILLASARVEALRITPQEFCDLVNICKSVKSVVNLLNPETTPEQSNVLINKEKDKIHEIASTSNLKTQQKGSTAKHLCAMFNAMSKLALQKNHLIVKAYKTNFYQISSAQSRYELPSQSIENRMRQTTTGVSSPALKRNMSGLDKRAVKKSRVTPARDEITIDLEEIEPNQMPLVVENNATVTLLSPPLTDIVVPVTDQNVVDLTGIELNQMPLRVDNKCSSADVMLLSRPLTDIVVPVKDQNVVDLTGIEQNQIPLGDENNVTVRHLSRPLTDRDIPATDQYVLDQAEHEFNRTPVVVENNASVTHLSWPLNDKVIPATDQYVLDQAGHEFNQTPVVVENNASVMHLKRPLTDRVIPATNQNVIDKAGLESNQMPLRVDIVVPVKDQNVVDLTGIEQNQIPLGVENNASVMHLRRPLTDRVIPATDQNVLDQAGLELNQMPLRVDNKSSSADVMHRSWPLTDTNLHNKLTHPTSDIIKNQLQTDINNVLRQTSSANNNLVRTQSLIDMVVPTIVADTQNIIIPALQPQIGANSASNPKDNGQIPDKNKVSQKSITSKNLLLYEMLARAPSIPPLVSMSRKTVIRRNEYEKSKVDIIPEKPSVATNPIIRTNELDINKSPTAYSIPIAKPSENERLQLFNDEDTLESANIEDPENERLEVCNNKDALGETPIIEVSKNKGLKVLNNKATFDDNSVTIFNDECLEKCNNKKSVNDIPLTDFSENERLEVVNNKQLINKNQEDECIFGV